MTSSHLPHPAKTAPLRAVAVELGEAVRRLFEMSHERGIVLLGTDFTVRAYNQLSHSLLSHNEQEVWQIGVPLSVYVAPHSAIEYRTCFEQAVATRKPQRLERTFHSTHGSIALEIYFDPLFQADGTVHHIALLTQNLTTYRDAIATVHANMDYYRMLLDHAPQAILVVGEETLLYSNLAAARLLGNTTTTALIHQPWSQVLQTPMDSPLVRLLQQRHEQDQKVVTIEDRLYRSDGETLDVIIHAYATYYNDSPAIQLVLNNVSDHKRSEAILRANADYFRTLIEHSNDLIKLIDARGTVICKPVCQTIVWL